MGKKEDRREELARREGFVTREEAAYQKIALQMEQDQRIQNELRLIRQRHPSSDS